MNKIQGLSRNSVLITSALIFLIIIGICARFYRITDPSFVYYDEGLYLIHNIHALYEIDRHPPQNLSQYWACLNNFWHAALADTKTIWFFLANLRTLIVGTEGVYFTKLLSAIFGVLTIGVIYLIGRSFYSSRLIGLLAAAILALLPSHVYYSRLGLQEAISTFLFTLGLYFYLSAFKLNWRVILSGFLFGCVFFTNYRMIILPFIVLFIEAYLSFSTKQSFNFRKYIYNTVVFLVIVFGFGALDNGANTKITFGWMFHQANLAKGTFDWVNLFSYPYYIFRFETIILAVLFFGNIYYLRVKELRRMLPFTVVIVFIVIFSLPQEKGLRYLCIAYPLVALAASSLIDYLYENVQLRKKMFVFSVGTILTFSWLIVETCKVAQFHSDYAIVVDRFNKQNIPVRISATQPVVFKVLAGEKSQVVKPAVKMIDFLQLYQGGVRYFILDPQAYVSFTDDGRRFSLKLMPFLDFVMNSVPPEKVFPHFSDELLARFVMEHNENLTRSIGFLNSNKEGKFNKLYIYDVGKILASAKTSSQK